jgi:hypothetical protein
VHTGSVRGMRMRFASWPLQLARSSLGPMTAPSACGDADIMRGGESASLAICCGVSAPRTGSASR